MSRTGLALRALRLTLSGAKADPTPDYDVASISYDDYFTEHMGKHSMGMLDHVIITPGDTVVELACGTGHLTAEIARRLEGSGTLKVVDISAGMLEVARRKVRPSAALHLQFSQGDMAQFLSTQASSSADLIVIGWAICYSQPVRLLRDVVRVLRPGGQVAIIETRSTALAGLRDAFETVVAGDPSMMTAMIRVSLPRSASTVGRWFRKAGLAPIAISEGEQQLPCKTAAQALEWVERSGAGAGFRDSFDVQRQDEIRQRLAVALETTAKVNGRIDLRHTFVVGVARREAVQPVSV